MTNFVLVCFYWLYYVLQFPCDPNLCFTNPNCCYLGASIFGGNLVRETDLNPWGCLSGCLIFRPSLRPWALATWLLIKKTCMVMCFFFNFLFYQLIPLSLYQFQLLSQMISISVLLNYFLDILLSWLEGYLNINGRLSTTMYNFTRVQQS